MNSCDLTEERDRISELPDGIITHILSFLSFKDAFVTTVLSRRWKNEWQYYSKLLHFDCHNFFKYELKQHERDILREKSSKYILEVNQVLKFHKAPTIEEFRISLELDTESTTVIDELIKFALKRKVQRLELDLNRHGLGSFDFNKRPYCLQLLSGPSNIISTCEELKSLRCLSLNVVNVSGEVVEKILASCPVLERLIVHESRLLERLKVSGPSLVLKYLDICRCLRFRYLELSNLRYLIGLKYMDFGGASLNFYINNVPELTELSIHRLHFSDTVEFISSFSRFSMLRSLELNKVIPSNEGFNPPELPNLRRFTLNVWWLCGDESLLRYTRFMKVAPLLETFVLRETWLEYPVPSNRKRRSFKNSGRHE